MGALTETERLKLGDLELIITKGLQTFVEVGAALAQIREGKLYRDSHETFEAYCQDKWGWTANRARRLISASDVVGSLSETVPMGTLPTSERQAREVAAVPEEHRAEVWQKAVETAPEGKVTAEHVKKTAAPYKPMSTRKPSAPKPKDDTPVIPLRKDGSIDKLAALRQQREQSLDVEAETRAIKRDVASSGWGRLTRYLTDSITLPPTLTREEIREAVASDLDGGYFRVARSVRDFLNIVIEELDNANREVTDAAS